MGKKYYSSLYFILFCCFSFPVNGQQQADQNFSLSTIRGIVLDEQGKPLPFATVTASLPSSPSTPVKGTLTSAEGEFKMILPAKTNFLITTRFLGYRDSVCHIKTDNNNINLGVLTLSPQSHLLEGATVRPALRVTADRIIYNFEYDPDRCTSNMMHMIKKMPLILVDDFTGKVYVESQTKSYIVLRNGKADALFTGSSVSFEDMLKKLPALGFTQFEIWQQPPLRYKNYDYVINILSDKKQQLFGAVGSSEAYHDFDKMYTTLRQGVTGSAENLRFSGAFTFLNENNPQRKQYIYSRYPATALQPEIRMDQKKKSQKDHQRYRGNLNTSYDLSEKHFVNLSFAYSRDHVDDQQKILTDSTASSLPIRYQHKTIDQTRYSDWQMGINYQYDFIVNSRTLNLSYSLNQNPDKNTQFINRTTEKDTNDGEVFNRQKKTKNYTHKLQIDYTDNFKNSKFTLDLDLGYLIKKYNDHSYSYHLISKHKGDLSSSAMNQDLHRIDGYAELKWNPNDRLCFTGKITIDYLPGINITELIYDQYSEKIKQQGLLYAPAFTARYSFTTPTSSEPDFREAFSLRSNIEFIYQQNRNRPSPQQMSNYTDISNPQWIKRGNPNLRPELTQLLIFKLSLGLPKNSRITPGFNYSVSNNKIMPYSSAEFTPSATRTVESYTNAKINTTGTTLSINYGTHLFINGNFSHAKINIQGDKNTSSFVHLNGIYNFDALKFLRITSILTYYKYYVKGARGTKTSYPFSLGFHLTPKAIKIGHNELRSSISLNNITNWKNSKSTQFVHTLTLDMETTSFHRSLPIALSLKYSFGKFKVKPLKQTRKKATIEGFSRE